MNCALCKKGEADKRNTHYLTDGIIRSCLNLDGSNDREKGFYFDLSNDTPFVEFNFQRSTNVDKLENSIGRIVTESEIEKAKNIPFSADFVFCSNCENIFTDIENKFIENILPSFRNSDLSKILIIKFDDTKLLRLFFYLQIWRTSVCDDKFTLPEFVFNDLRYVILNYENITVDQLNHFPLLITYLETTGGSEEYTTNGVGFTDDKNPYIILFNDFIIQFYQSPENIRCLEFHGLNSEVSFKDFINYKEAAFIINIFTNQKRKDFLKNLFTTDKVKPTIQMYTNGFREMWLKIFCEYPSPQTTQEFIETIINDNTSNILKYTNENILEVTARFMEKKMKLE